MKCWQDYRIVTYQLIAAVATTVVGIIIGAVLLGACPKETYRGIFHAFFSLITLDCKSTEQCGSNSNSSDYCYCIYDDGSLCSSNCFCAYINDYSSNGFCGDGGNFTRCKDKAFSGAGGALIAIGCIGFIYGLVMAGFWFRIYYQRKASQ